MARPILSPRHAALGAAIRAGREDRGLTIEELADQSGLSHSFVGRLERGVVNVSLERLSRLADVLDLPAADLVLAWERGGSAPS